MQVGEKQKDKKLLVLTSAFLTSCLVLSVKQLVPGKLYREVSSSEHTAEDTWKTGL